MPVLLCLITAPLGLCVLLGMSWFEDRVLRPPTSPADRVVQHQTPAELLRIVRGPHQLPSSAAAPPALPAALPTLPTLPGLPGLPTVRPALPRSEDTAA